MVNNAATASLEKTQAQNFATKSTSFGNQTFVVKIIEISKKKLLIDFRLKFGMR